MKYFLKIVLVVTFTLGFNESKANTLFDSLNSAYLNNPKLNAERANMRASKENLLVNFFQALQFQVMLVNKKIRIQEMIPTFVHQNNQLK